MCHFIIDEPQYIPFTVNLLLIFLLSGHLTYGNRDYRRLTPLPWRTVQRIEYILRRLTVLYMNTWPPDQTICPPRTRTRTLTVSRTITSISGTLRLVLFQIVQVWDEFWTPVISIYPALYLDLQDSVGNTFSTQENIIFIIAENVTEI